LATDDSPKTAYADDRLALHNTPVVVEVSKCDCRNSP
jgi:hypothetical protein